MARRTIKKVSPQAKKDSVLILKTLEDAARPLDAAELQIKSGLNGSRIKAAMSLAVAGGLYKVTKEGELIPRYSSNAFGQQKRPTVKGKAKTRAGKKLVLKPAPKSSSKTSSKTSHKEIKTGVSVTHICTYRRRDNKTGRLLPNPASKTEHLYTRDGLKVTVKYSLDEYGEMEKLNITNITGLERDGMRGASASEKARYLKNLKEGILEEFQREHDHDRSRRHGTAEMNRDRAKRGAETKAAKAKDRVKKGLPAKPEVDRNLAKNLGETLAAKLLEINQKLNKTKSPKVKRTLTARRNKLTASRAQVLKIAQGKASKFPSPSAMR